MDSPAPRVPTVYVDADACPVKDEIYRVAGRHGVRVAVVANAPMRVPTSPTVEMVVRPGFAAADDWIAEQAGPGDVVVTADIPLAARALEKGSRALDFKGNPFTDNDIHQAMAMRDLMRGLRADGTATGGPAPMTPKDRSRFLSKLDEMLVAARRGK
ncbi:MAG: YaiI/YqxD family protein [Fimbriiglobus sp.]